MTARCEWPACDCTNGTASCPKQRQGARWEPLETAEEVVAAHADGRKVEMTAGDCDCQLPSEGRGWIVPTHLHSRQQIACAINEGARYRALIEDSK